MLKYDFADQKLDWRRRGFPNRAIVEELGGSPASCRKLLPNVTKTTVLLTSMSDFATVNEIYSKS